MRASRRRRVRRQRLLLYDLGDGRAGFAGGNFYAEPQPQVKMRRPGPPLGSARWPSRSGRCTTGSSESPLTPRQAPRWTRKLSAERRLCVEVPQWRSAPALMLRTDHDQSSRCREGVHYESARDSEHRDLFLLASQQSQRDRLSWLVRSLAFDFFVPFLFADVLRLPRDLYYGIYIVAVGGFFVLWARATGQRLGVMVRRRWRLAVVLGLIFAVLLGFFVFRANPPPPVRGSGVGLGGALAWGGLRRRRRPAAFGVSDPGGVRRGRGQQAASAQVRGTWPWGRRRCWRRWP